MPTSRARYTLTLTLALSLVVGRPSHAERGDSAGSPPSNHPRFTARCQSLSMARVSTIYADFERMVTAWMATCVTSRSGDAHREVELVRGNRSLAMLWSALVKGQPARIIPHYTWGTFRVTRVTFSSPDARIEVPGDRRQNKHPTGRPPTPDDAHRDDGADPHLDDVTDGSTDKRSDTPSGKKPTPTERPRPRKGPIPPLSPHLPNDADDLLFDARRLVQQMRENGNTKEADALDRRVETAAKVLGSVALLAGGYYVGVKLRAGRLLFAWGWNATGDHFARSAARLERLLPEAERAIGEVIQGARPHVPPAGSGIDWRVLDQVVNGSVPAQLDGAACGPACLQMVLAARGIKMAQDELIRRARATIHPEIKSKRVTARAVLNVLRQIDSAGNWLGGGELSDDLLRDRTASQLVEYLGRRGSWIAQVDAHLVVVDGYEPDGFLRIRDPWYEPARERGIASGSSYRVSLRTFVERWHAVAIYRD